MLVLAEIGVLMLVVTFLTCLSQLMATCLLSCNGLLMWIYSCFACLGMMMDIIA
jgi:hypothetical protein